MWAVGVGFMWLNEKGKGKGRGTFAAMRQVVGFMASWAVGCELTPDKWAVNMHRVVQL